MTTRLFRRAPRCLAIGAAVTLVAATMSGLAPAAPPALAQAAPALPAIESVLLSPLSSHDLAAPGLDGQVKRRGQNNDVAVLGRTAFVAAGAAFHGAQSTPGRTCTDHGGVKVMDLTDPVRPTMISTITMEDTNGVVGRGNVKLNNVSVTASSVDARSVRTPTFNGDVLAIATQRCERSFFFGARIEFWDVTNPATPSRIGIFDPATITFGTATGRWGIFEDVRMFTRGSRLMAVATTPFSIGNAHDASPFGDFRLIDITDIRNPQQVGTFPPVSIGEGSINGCRTFQAGRSVAPTPDGNGAILSWYDGSAEFRDDRTATVFKLDLDNLPRHTLGASPQFNPNPPSWGYPYDSDVEGNAADVQPFLGAAGELRVMLSEDDIDPALTRVGIGVGATAQQYRGCTMLLGKHLYEYPGQQLASEIVYVGRACPASTLAGTTNTVAEELLANPAGKIAVVEGGGALFDGCSAMDKLNRLTAAGAVAVLTSGGGEVLNATTSAPSGGIASIPFLTVTQAAYNNVQLIPINVLGSAAFPVPSTGPPIWERTSTTNVTGVAFPGRTDKGRYKMVADATDRVARAQLAAAGRSPVTAGQQYQASVFLGVESITGGAFRAAVVWYDAGGAALSEDEITSLSAVTPRARFERSVTVPAGAVKVGMKAEWTGGDAAAGTAYADTFSLVRPGLQGTLKDNRGQWGAQRVLDFSGTNPTEIGTYRSPKSLQWPPPDAGLYAPRQARMFGRELAFTTWLSDGLRVLDVTGSGQPREVASFVPPATTDPMPQAGAGGGLLRGESWGTKTLVAGIDIIPTSDSSGIAVVSDINAGIYMQAFQIQRVGEVAPGGTANAGPGAPIRLVGTGFAPGSPVRLTLGDGRDIGAVTADGSGSFSTAVTLPLDIRPGSYAIQAAGAAAGGGANVLRYNLVIPSMGYWTVASDGGVFSFGRSGFFGSTGAIRLNQPMVAMAATPTALGYWLVAADGGVFAFGDAAFRGSTGGTRLNRPIVGMAATPTGRGYWLVASDGGVFAFGDAPFLGSTGGIRLNSPVVGMAPTSSGRGYWLVAADGGVFSFGDAGFKGSTGGIRLNLPVVGMASTPSGNGYWLVATDGGVFSFGDARFFGSTGAIRLNQPVTGMASTPSGGGYWLVATDGGIFSFGNAEFSGSTGGIRLTKPMVGMARFPRV